MKSLKKFKEFEKLVKVSNILKNVNPIEDGNGNMVNSIFTTSQEMDIMEMIKDGLSIDEMIDIVKQW